MVYEVCVKYVPLNNKIHFSVLESSFFYKLNASKLNIDVTSESASRFAGFITILIQMTTTLHATEIFIFMYF